MWLWPAQARWLARDLAAVDRARTPWVLVTFHNPWRARRTLPYPRLLRCLAHECVQPRNGTQTMRPA